MLNSCIQIENWLWQDDIWWRLSLFHLCLIRLFLITQPLVLCLRKKCKNILLLLLYYDVYYLPGLCLRKKCKNILLLLLYYDVYYLPGLCLHKKCKNILLLLLYYDVYYLPGWIVSFRRLHDDIYGMAIDGSFKILNYNFLNSFWGNTCYHVGSNVIMWDQCYHGEWVKCYPVGSNFIIFCYHAMLSWGMMTPPPPPPFYFSWKLHRLLFLFKKYTMLPPIYFHQYYWALLASWMFTNWIGEADRRGEMVKTLSFNLAVISWKGNWFLTQKLHVQNANNP